MEPPIGRSMTLAFGAGRTFMDMAFWQHRSFGRPDGERGGFVHSLVLALHSMSGSAKVIDGIINLNHDFGLFDTGDKLILSTLPNGCFFSQEVVFPST
jgi:hypothetical protein